jgi:hypothetical protein
MEGVPNPEHTLRHVSGLATLTDRIDLAFHHVGAPPSEAFGMLQNGGFVLESLPMSLWCFASHPEDPAAAIMTAVNGGKDTDTIAAMTGAMAGAYHGVSGLPKPWVDHLEYVDGLAGYADDLLELSGMGKRGPMLVNRDRLDPATHAPFRLGGSLMPTIEHAIRASAADDPATALRIRLAPTPADARRMAASMKVRSGWSHRASATVASILERRFDVDSGAELMDADPRLLSRFSDSYRDDPFEYGELLAARRDELASASA